jgi:GrpB-like predicted nucleotidyltransferase (UPF0157 family)
MELDERITIVPYDARWPVWSEEEKERLRPAFADNVVDIQHFGSTAVPGMAAKPIVDLLVGVRTLGLDGATVDRLAEPGYEGFGEAGVRGGSISAKRRERFFNLAVVPWMGEHWGNNLLIRDFLRRHPEAARAYGERKMAAIRAGHTTLLAYSAAKADFVARLLEMAKRSAGRTGQGRGLRDG